MVVGAQLAAAQPGPRIDRAIVPGRPVEIRALHVPPSRTQLTSGSQTQQGDAVAQLGPVTADIQVTYTGFSADARAAFQAAVDVWETKLVSSQVIHVAASWTPLGSGILGSAGPTNIYKFNDESVWYPVALLEARCACNVNSSGNEISASFNSAFTDWYLGTDGNPPSDKYDLFTVVMHELGHGLGFLGSFNVSGGKGSWGYKATQSGPVYPMSYDTFEYTAATGGNQLINTALYANPSTALATQLTDGSVYFAGPNTVAANGGRAALYAPSPWNGGSSNAHFDETTFPSPANSLMTPYLNNGEVVHSVSALTLAVMQDIGWETSATPSPTASPTSTPTSAPTPTPTATLPIVDIGLPALTKNTTVAVSMTETDPAGTGIAGWFLSSISATPAVGDPGWQAVEPTTFALPAGDGVKTVYAWVKNNAGTISAADSATTTLIVATRSATR